MWFIICRTFPLNKADNIDIYFANMPIYQTPTKPSCRPNVPSVYKCFHYRYILLSLQKGQGTMHGTGKQSFSQLAARFRMGWIQPNCCYHVLSDLSSLIWSLHEKRMQISSMFNVLAQIKWWNCLFNDNFWFFFEILPFRGKNEATVLCMLFLSQAPF